MLSCNIDLGAPDLGRYPKKNLKAEVMNSRLSKGLELYVTATSPRESP